MKKYILYAAFALPLALMATPSSAQFSISVGVSIRTAPPPLPVYVQPACPTDGYLWSPGYWAYGDDGYYWVPGVWVAAPQPGYLWTPGYWGYAGGVYGWNGGYWGPHVGFYGGCNYGGGYGGVGFIGGGWSGGHFRYNTAVVNVNTTVIHNTYVDRTVINNTTVINNRASFNGPGGITRQPNAQEQSFSHENHVQPTSEQFNHNHTASTDKTAYASANHGRPAVTAMNRVGGNHFSSQGHVAAAAHPGGTAITHPANRTSGVNPGAHAAPGGVHPNTVHPAGTPGGSHPNTYHPAPSRPTGNPGGSHPSTVHPSGSHPAPSHPAPSHPAGNPGGAHPGGARPAEHPAGGGEHHGRR